MGRFPVPAFLRHFSAQLPPKPKAHGFSTLGPSPCTRSGPTSASARHGEPRRAPAEIISCTSIGDAQPNSTWVWRERLPRLNLHVGSTLLGKAFKAFVQKYAQLVAPRF